MLTSDTDVGPYRIISLIGAGGMGEVYRARDARLGRDVAIKVIPAALSRTPDRIRRFEKEARAAGALSHPNVCAVLDIGTFDGSPYVVMELLEGESLRSRLRQGPVPPRKAVDWVAQAAHGLAAAHGKGIVHRDLKPENIFLTRDGRVKILDFGLAKLTRPDFLRAAGEEPVTITATAAGAIMGTVGYMSPEQVRGEPADHRADLFALGSILYELLTGTKAFPGDTFVDTSYRILNDDPPPLAVAGRVLPAGLDGLVRRCLEKSPDQRFQNAEDLAFSLEAINSSASGAVSSTAAGTPGIGNRAVRSRPSTLILAAALPVVLAIGLWLGRGTRPEGAAGRGPITKFQIDLPVGLRLPIEAGPCLAISPDGGLIVFAGTVDGEEQLYRRPRGQTTYTPIPGTTGACSPFFSPDGEWIGYGAGGHLRKLSLRDGREVVLCPAPRVTGACWTEADSIVFAPDSRSPLMIVAASGGESRPVTRLGEESTLFGHMMPAAVNGGAQVLFAMVSGWSYSKPRLAVLDRRSAEVRILLENASSPAPGPDDELLFTRDGAVMAVRFDRRRLETLSDPLPVGQGVAGDQFTALSRARDGTICFVADIGAGSLNRDRLVWIDKAGTVEPLALPSAAYVMPTLSPDGEKLAVTIFEPDGFDLWVHDLQRGTRGRLSPGGNNHVAIWARDMSEVYFTSDRDGPHNIYAQSLVRREPARRLTTSANHQDPVTTTPDGKYLVYWDNLRETRSDLRLLPLAGGESRALVATAANESHAAISPDGSCFAYTSDESGLPEVYLEPLDGLGERVQVSVDGGHEPVWDPKGDSLYYRSPDCTRLYAVTVESHAPLRFSRPVLIARGSYRCHPSGIANYAVHPVDGRILMIEAGEDAQRRGVEVILNWRAERPR